MKNPAKSDSNPLRTQEIEALFKRRVLENVVAGILELIHAVPNKRDSPLPGDLEGRFDFWFDGGACTEVTGYSEYVFRDGVMAREEGIPLLSITMHSEKRYVRN